jgi:hypothetical protein
MYPNGTSQSYSIPDTLSLQRTFTTNGSAPIAIVDIFEDVTLTPEPANELEYAVSDANGDDFSYLVLRPADSSYDLYTYLREVSIRVQFELHDMNTSGLRNSARPGNKNGVPTGYTGSDPSDFYLELLDGTPLNVYLVDGNPMKYRSDSVPEMYESDDVRIRVVPINDTRIEDDELVDARLHLSGIQLTDRLTDLRQLTIKEEYIGNRPDSDQTAKECSCSCGCGAVKTSFNIYGVGNVTVKAV